jgi:hypothetical protein
MHTDLTATWGMQFAMKVFVSSIVDSGLFLCTVINTQCIHAFHQCAIVLHIAEGPRSAPSICTQIPITCWQAPASHSRVALPITHDVTSRHQDGITDHKRFEFPVRLHACRLTLWLMSNILKKYGMAAG